VLPLMAYRPNALFADGVEHHRLRAPIVDALSRIDLMTLRGYIERSADLLIDRFAPAGRADLLHDYASSLPVRVLTQLFGCDDDMGERMHATMSALFRGVDTEANVGSLITDLGTLIAVKRREPANDMASWLIAHESGLTDEELVHELAMLLGSSTLPEQDLILSSLRLLLGDSRFAGSLYGGSALIGDAIDEVLWADSPMANYGVHFARQDVTIDGMLLPEGHPIVVSFAAASTDPSLGTDQRSGNRAHLAWSAGPHACPAQREAHIIATVAVERLLDRLPDVELAVHMDELKWQPGPFQRSLSSLPVRFTRMVPPPGVFPPSTVPATAPRPGRPAAPAAPGAVLRPSVFRRIARRLLGR
jgi:cytochrome P450